ncbi:hypothetical protein Tco_0894976 [Tanacetum coccineum]|uniref:Uncharacterized protein n=1 Tax=Tanacetum coccineum TaxID=301880 RepID=A0ABQ5CEI5_9ASTR
MKFESTNSNSTTIDEDTSSKAMLAIDGVATYKRGLTTIEEQLITYRKNEVVFSEEVVVLKREVACKDYEKNILKSEFEKVNAFPPPHPLIYNRPKKLDLSYSSLDEFKEPEFKGYGSEDSKKESNVVCDKKSDDSKENSDNSLAQCKYHQREGVVYGNTYKRVNYNYTTNRNHLNAQRNMVPRAVLMKTGVKTFNTARTVNTAHPKSIGKPQQDDTGFVASGCLRHMTGNIAYLSDFKEFDRGYVTFEGEANDVGNEAAHKELGDKMERAATTASSLEAEQDSGAQTRFETTSNSPMNHLSQELTHLEVGRTQTAALCIIEDGVQGITATIDRKLKVLVTEASIRRHLKLEDSKGLKTLPTTEIFEQLALMGSRNMVF